MDAPTSTTEAMPRSLRSLVLAVVAGGVISAAIALLVVPWGATPQWWYVGLAFLVVLTSRLIRIRLQLGSRDRYQDWSEAGLILLLALLGSPWVIVAVAAGACAADLWKRLDRVKVAFNVSTSVLVAALGLLILHGFGVNQPDAFSVRGAVGLIIAAGTSMIVSDIATSGAVVFSRSGSFRSALFDGLTAKFIGFLSNIMVSFAILWILQTNIVLLACAPPVIWLLHQGYAGQVRERAERRAWQRLAASTHSLNRLDREDVIREAIAGAARLFWADVVEIELRSADSSPVLYRGTEGGLTWQGAPSPTTPPMKVFETRLATALVPGDEFSVLRLCFRGQAKFGERETLALSTFADSLSSALRNADVHEQLRSLAERKAYEATHDPLTGLPNRVHLTECSNLSLQRTTDDNEEVPWIGLLLLDFNHFKDVNDTLGHGAGDRLLQQASKRLSKAILPGEVLARLGGDEFAMLIPATPNADSAVRFAQYRATALLDALAEPLDIDQVALTVEASVGVAVVAAGGCDFDELMRRADVAMYQAKRGAEPIACYDEGKDAGSLDRLALTTELQHALDSGDQFVLELQPSVELSTGGPLGAEALIRWHHPRRGLLNPTDFIPQIEQTDLIGPLTRCILDLALTSCATWTDDLDVPIAVNLSARSLLNRDLPKWVGELLERHKVPPRQLVLEITETVMMSELDIIDDVLNGLREMGVQISLDDFGTGYSSLTFLARVKVDEVKIDQGFVSTMHTSPEAAAIVRTTVELARSLGYRVIAEGIEDAGQRDVLAQLGCTGGQGYFLHPPMGPEKAREAMLADAAEAAGHSSARVIPLGPKRTPLVTRRDTGTDEGKR